MTDKVRPFSLYKKWLGSLSLAALFFRCGRLLTVHNWKVPPRDSSGNLEEMYLVRGDMKCCR